MRQRVRDRAEDRWSGDRLGLAIARSPPQSPKSQEKPAWQSRSFLTTDPILRRLPILIHDDEGHTLVIEGDVEQFPSVLKMAFPSSQKSASGPLHLFSRYSRQDSIQWRFLDRQTDGQRILRAVEGERGRLIEPVPRPGGIEVRPLPLQLFRSADQPLAEVNEVVSEDGDRDFIPAPDPSRTHTSSQRVGA